MPVRSVEKRKKNILFLLKNSIPLWKPWATRSNVLFLSSSPLSNAILMILMRGLRFPPLPARNHNAILTPSLFAVSWPGKEKIHRRENELRGPVPTSSLSPSFLCLCPLNWLNNQSSVDRCPSLFSSQLSLVLSLSRSLNKLSPSLASTMA